MNTTLRNRPDRRVLPLACGIALILAGATTAPAVVRTWNGSESIYWTNAVNWVGGVVPTNNDFTDDIVFTENSPGNKTPTHGNTREIRNVTFNNSTGWTIKPSKLTCKPISSTGVGTNTIDCEVEVRSGQTCTVGPENTLVIKVLRLPNYGMNVTGGGTLQLNGQIVGNSPAVYYVNVNAATLRIAAASPTALTTSYVKINHKAARLELKTTIANAKSMIGDDKRIRDGVGTGLAVTDIGGGYVEILVAPRGTLITLR